MENLRGSPEIWSALRKRQAVIGITVIRTRGPISGAEESRFSRISVGVDLKGYASEQQLIAG
jgi:hypothetical protein